MQLYRQALTPLGEETLDLPLNWLHIGTRKALLRHEDTQKQQGARLNLRITGLEGCTTGSIMALVAKELEDTQNVLVIPSYRPDLPGGTVFLVTLPNERAAKKLLALNGAVLGNGQRVGVAPQETRPTLEGRINWVWETLKLEERANKMGKTPEDHTPPPGVERESAQGTITMGRTTTTTTTTGGGPKPQGMTM